MKAVVSNCIVEARDNFHHKGAQLSNEPPCSTRAEQETGDTRSSGILSSIQRDVIVFCMVGLPACVRS